MEDGTQRTVELDELPLELPLTDNYQPSDNGESPLANCKDWLNVEIDGMKGTRETNTIHNGLEVAGISCVILIHIMINNCVIQSYWNIGCQLIYM